MAIFNGNKEFSKKRELSQPLVPVPKNVRQAFNIQKAYANGVFQLETKKKDTLYDRCYVFEDINYINKNRTEKKNFLSELMFWLNSMDASYKITLCNEYQSVEKFLASIRNERNEKEYPDIAKGIRQWQESKLADANSTVRTLRYLTITCRADSLDQANIYFRALEPMIEDAFAGWGSDIAVLGTLDRFRVLHGMLRPGEEFPQAVLRDALQDWKSDVLPRSIQQFNDYLILGDTVMTVLTATQYRKSLDTDTFLHTLSSLSYPSFVTLDFAPVQQEVINDKLVAMHMNNEREINDEIEQKQSVEKFLASIRNERNEREYPDIAKGIRQWQESKLADANSTVRTLRYLTITCRADSLAQANIYFRALEPMIEDAFAGWGSDIAVLGTLDRFRVLHGMLRPGEEFPQVVLRETLQDWKSDILPRSIQQFNDYIILGDTMVTVLTATQYRKSLDTDTFLHTLSSLPYPSFVTLDFAPVQQEVINDKLVAMHMNNEREINDEIEQKRQAGQIVTSPSYTKKKRRDEIEEYIEMVDANDEKGVFLNLLVVLTAPVKEGVELLQERMEEVCAIGRSDKVGAFLEPCDFRQLKALNTALPIGGRQVDYMRFFLTSSLVTFNPYHAQDILEPGGKMLGINKTTGRYLIANRKLLPNPHGIIVGYSGSGKSMLIKLTEISQTLLGSEDDIIVLDPQNEFEDICREYQGVYFDLTPKSGIYLNGFEVTQEVFSGSKELKAEFVAKQCEYAKGLVQAIMKNILVTQEHDSV